LTFEETEKRRMTQLAGPKDRKGLGALLLLLFLGSTVALLFLVVAPEAHAMAADYPLTGAVGAFGGLVLLAMRFGAYRKKRGAGASLSLAFLDIMAWVGVIGVLVWSFVFPILAPFPTDTILYLFYLPAFPIGVYSLTFIWAMLIVLRVVLQPFTKPPSEKVYADIETSLRKLTDTVSQVGQRMRGTDQKMDPAFVDKVSSIMSEITAVRHELSTIKTAGPSGFSVASPVSGTRIWAPQEKAIVVPRESVAVMRPEASRGATPESGVSVPESTIDNPWLDVLSKRRAKPSKDGQ
jgi:hypothetical protein